MDVCYPMRRTFFELGSIAGLVIMAALVSQLFFPNRIPFFTTYLKTEPESGNKRIPTILVNQSNPAAATADTDSLGTTNHSMLEENPALIGTFQALEIFESKQGIMIDARDQDQYEAGHIVGAWNIPYARFLDNLDKLDRLPLDTLMVTYCDGEECNASMELANSLVSMGFTRVRFYFGGWNSWVQENHPVTTGPSQ